MRPHLLPVALAALLIPADGAGKNDADRFKGSWQTRSLEFAGEKIPREEFRDDLITFDDKEYTQEKGDEVVERGRYTLDPSRKPRWIDFDITEGREKGKHQVGIYEFSGDALKICVAMPGAEERPTEFATKPESMTALVVLERKRPKGVPTSR